MKEMPEQDRPNDADPRARRKRIAEKAGRVLLLAGTVAWLLVLIGISSTGYVSWTGIVVVASVIGACALSSVAGMTGRRRAEKLLARLSQIAVLLIAVTVAAFVDPTGNDAFVYALDGDSFKLYSRGDNRIDDGGRHRYVKALDKREDDISMWPPPPEPPDEESMKKELEDIYGKDYVEATFQDKGSDKR